MINQHETTCPICGGKLKYYDTVKRMVKGEYGKKKYIYLSSYK